MKRRMWSLLLPFIFLSVRASFAQLLAIRWRSMLSGGTICFTANVLGVLEAYRVLAGTKRPTGANSE